MRIHSFLTVLALALNAALPATARAEAALLIEAASGTVLHADNATTPQYPASLTKMMTVYLLLEAVETGQMKPDTVLPVSAQAAGQAPVKLGLKAGETITVRETLLALITRSANDAAVVAAEALAADEAAFARLMTAKARALGMASTVFVNASGLPAPGQKTTARDMAVLGRALWRDFPQYGAIFGARGFRWKQETLPTINGFLTGYPGADGLKTGFTCAAGFNLVASATREGRRLIGVIMGEASRGERNAEMVALFNRGFALPPAKAGGSVDTLPAAPDQAQPQTRLSGGTCAQLAGAATSAPAAWHQIPTNAWGVVVGMYPQEPAAREAARKAMTLAKAGRPAVLPIVAGGMIRHRALVAGLSQDLAMAACSRMMAAGSYCITVSPASLAAAVEAAKRNR